MRTANILTGLAIALWLGMFLLGRQGISDVVDQGVPGYPNTGQIDSYLLLPVCVVMMLLACAWVSNGLRKWEGPLALISGLSVAALLPYLLMYGGGV